MSDVNAETLQDLMERRLKELGQRRGRGEQISLHEAYDRLVESGAKDVPTYEVFRRIRQGHTSRCAYSRNVEHQKRYIGGCQWHLSMV